MFPGSWGGRLASRRHRLMLDSELPMTQVDVWLANAWRSLQEPMYAMLFRSFQDNNPVCFELSPDGAVLNPTWDYKEGWSGIVPNLSIRRSFGQEKVYNIVFKTLWITIHPAIMSKPITLYGHGMSLSLLQRRGLTNSSHWAQSMESGHRPWRAQDSLRIQARWYGSILFRTLGYPPTYIRYGRHEEARLREN